MVVHRDRIRQKQRAAERQDGDQIACRALDEPSHCPPKCMERIRGHASDHQPGEQEGGLGGPRSRELKARAKQAQGLQDPRQNDRQHGRLRRIKVTVPPVVNHVVQKIVPAAVPFGHPPCPGRIVNVEDPAQGQAFDCHKAGQIVLPKNAAMREDEQEHQHGDAQPGGTRALLLGVRSAGQMCLHARPPLCCASRRNR